MRICIFGAGAIGSLLAGLFGRDGEEVTVIGRGEHIRAIAAQGLDIVSGDSRFHVAPRVATPAEAGQFDVVFVTLKSHQLAAARDDIAALLKPDGRAIFVLNGIPWWYFHGIDSPFAGTDIAELDAGGALRQAIGIARTIGGVIYAGAEVRAPGTVTSTSAARFAIGAIAREPQAVIAPLAARLTASGLKTEEVANIRSDVWMKLQGNTSMLPVSALTLLRNSELMNDPGLGPLTRRIMGEIRDVAAAHGITTLPTPEARFEQNRRIGPSKSSMLQDVERGRPVEVDALSGAFLRLARMADVETPAADIVHALIAARDWKIRNPS